MVIISNKGFRNFSKVNDFLPRCKKIKIIFYNFFTRTQLNKLLDICFMFLEKKRKKERIWFPWHQQVKKRVILPVFQRIYLIGFANNVSKERQIKTFFRCPMRAILGNARWITVKKIMQSTQSQIQSMLFLNLKSFSHKIS